MYVKIFLITINIQRFYNKMSFFFLSVLKMSICICFCEAAKVKGNQL